jgi:hypothetical protein
MSFKIAVGVCYGRGGSFFLHSLLDGHPQVMSLPPYMMNLAQHIIDTLTLDNMAFAEQFVDDYRNLFTDDLSLCSSNKYINIDNNVARTQTGLLNLDPNIFSKLLCHELGNIEACFKTRFIAIHTTIYKALGIDTKDKTTIFYQLHTPHYQIMRQLRDSFGYLKVCHSVRDPIATFIRMCMSHCNDLQNSDDYQSAIGVARVESCFRHFLYAGCDLTDNENSSSLAIKLESLHAEPKKLLLAVCEFLNITWHDILLKETINHGQNWQGIIGDTTGFNLEKTLANNQKYRNFMTEFDLIRLEKIARARLIKWQYPLHYEQHKIKLDFEAPYSFELFPYTKPDSIVEQQDTAIISEVLPHRGELHRAILKTINYMPEILAP